MKVILWSVLLILVIVLYRRWMTKEQKKYPNRYKEQALSCMSKCSCEEYLEQKQEKDYPGGFMILCTENAKGWIGTSEQVHHSLQTIFAEDEDVVRTVLYDEQACDVYYMQKHRGLPLVSLQKDLIRMAESLGYHVTVIQAE